MALLGLYNICIALAVILTFFTLNLCVYILSCDLKALLQERQKIVHLIPVQIVCVQASCASYHGVTEYLELEETHKDH